METVYIGVGSNLGDKQNNCLKAIEMLSEISGCELIDSSDWYLTKPVGVEEQDWYVNGVASLSAGISARDLLKNLLTIEEDMGRVRKKRWASRIIDLDILLFGREIINERGLTVPHPLMHLRRFVLLPLVQLAPDLIHPSLGVTTAELLQRIPEDGQIAIHIKEQ